RKGKAFGIIGMRRVEAQPFSEQQIELLKTFADQAVIAIENTRLFNELERRNKDLTEALEQQTATSDILRVISSSPTQLQPVLDAVAKSSARLCDARDALIVLVKGDSLSVVGKYGERPGFGIGHMTPLNRQTTAGRAVLDARFVHVPDILAEPDAEFALSKAFARASGARTVLTVPMIREGIAIGAISIRRTEVLPFTNSQVALLNTFADQAVIAIENTRLFTELQEQLEQQTATSEILRVISQSQRDVQPVFEAIAANARKLCRGYSGWVGTFDGELLNAAAGESLSPQALKEFHRAYP